jgi:flagellar hook-associated protein 2
VSALSLSGLSGSGIDTTALVAQLMSVAAAPQNRLKTQLSTQTSATAAYQAINTKLTALTAAADALKLSDTWAGTKATSTSTAVVASSTTAAGVGSATTFDVTKLAKAQISTVSGVGTVVTTPASGINIVDSLGASHHVALTTGTAAGVAAAVNATAFGVRASVITTDAGSTLQFTSTTTGTGGAFSITGLDNAPQTIVAGQNAQIAVGDPLAGGYTVSSSTNTFNNVITGVTFSVGAEATGVTISVASDSSAISDKVKALVDAANAALTEVGKNTGKGALLENNFQMKAITQSVLSVISHGDVDENTFATIGVQLTSTGSLKFDADAFAAAYAADPTKAQTSVAGSLATTLSSFSSDTSIRTVTPMINSGNVQVININKQIAAWDTRLATQQTSLQQKYTAMEAAVNKLQATSGWLTTALASLDNSKSKN